MPDTLLAPRPPPADPLLPALRHAVREGRGRVVLRVEDAAPHRRRLARTLLQEGALAAGGQVLDGPGGDLLLVGAEAQRAERLRGLLDRLVGPASTLVWSLERDGAALLDYATRGTLAAPRPEGPGLDRLDAVLDAQPLPGLVRHRHGVTLTPAGPAPAFLRLEPSRAALAALLGPLGGDRDLLDHAVRRIAGRLLAALASPREAPALIGAERPRRLHLPIPPGLSLPAGAAPPGMLVATLPLAAAAEPEALLAHREALARAGIALEIDGLGAAALGLVAADALPADLLRLHWSPGLETGALLRRVDATRIVLAGAPGPEAAARLGLVLMELA